MVLENRGKMLNSKTKKQRFLACSLKSNKKAQLGETMTWVVATIVIIGILLIFTFISSVFAKSNGMIVSLKRVFSSDEITEVNWVKEKTDLAYGHKLSNKEIIDNWIKKGEQE